MHPHCRRKPNMYAAAPAEGRSPATAQPEQEPADPPAKKLILGKYQLGRVLGRGATAKVYHARDLSTGGSFAVKCISKGDGPLHRDLLGSIDREVSALRRLRHPHVIRLHELLATRGHVYLVMEHARGGELFERLACGGRLSEPLARKYFRQLVSAVGHCHARGVYHRDLKPENLLLADNGGVLKVSDFGLSIASVPAGELTKTACGTPAYVAPEVLAKRAYDPASADIWSCGVILYTMVAGYLPFNDHNLMNMYRKICRGMYECPRCFSPELRLLISRIFDANPITRITLAGILEDPWFRNGLSASELEELGRFRGDELEVANGKWSSEMEDRDMNAFDIITMSSGCNLSGLFEEEAPRREAFAAAGTPEEVVRRIEEFGGGWWTVEVRRRGKGTGLLVTEGGNPVGTVAVRSLGPGTVMVESEWTGKEGWVWFRIVKAGMAVSEGEFGR